MNILNWLVTNWQNDAIFRYDLLFFIILSLITGIFLYKRKQGLVKEGIMFLYKTKVGLKVIEKISKKNKKLLKILSPVIILLGYVLMILMVLLLIELVYFFTKPELVKIVKIPPLMPLIPYLPSLFKVTWLPPFYSTYWILAIGIIAIVHEGFHGVYAKLYNVKIKSTGFGFLGPILIYPVLTFFAGKKDRVRRVANIVILILILILLAILLHPIILFLLIFPLLAFFVEQDDKQMNKKPIKQQLTILAAGVFSNILVGLLFLILMIGFFHLTYAPNGVVFTDYIYSPMPSSLLNQANITNEKLIIGEINFTKVIINNTSYFVWSDYISREVDDDFVIKYYLDLPAIRTGLKGTIIKINNQTIKTYEDLDEEIEKYSINEKITIKTIFEEKEIDYNITLKEGEEKEKGLVGIGFAQKPSGFKGFMYKLLNIFKDPKVNYEPKFFPEPIVFFYNLLWWLVLINISVGIVNMLPAGMFDGGRFFYLSILALTKREKIAKISYKIATWLLVTVLILLMILWGFGYFN